MPWPGEPGWPRSVWFGASWGFLQRWVLPRASLAGNGRPLPLRRRQGGRQAAAVGELGQVYVLLDGMDFVLPGADGQRRQAVLDKPVGVQAAVGKHGGW